VHLVTSTVLGVIGVYTWNSDKMSIALFGEHWQDSYVWWLMAVPLYIYVGIYFARYVGSFLARTWAKEISKSSVTHKAVVELARGVLSDPATPALLASVINHETVQNSIRDVTATLLSSPQVQHAASLSSAAVLQHPATLEAAATATGSMLKNPQLAQDLEACLDSSEMTAFVATQVCELLQNQKVADAAADFLHDLFSKPQASQVLKDRAVSIIQDPKVYRAGGRGLVESLNFGAIPRCFGSPTSNASSLNDHVPSCDV